MAGRGLSVSQINASAGPHRVICPLMEMDFDSGTLRLALFPWNVIVGADTYTRAPVVVEPLKESAANPEGFGLQLSGVDPAIIELATAEPYQGRDFRLRKAFVQPDSNQVIDTPRVALIGRMRNMVVTEDNTSAIVSLFIEHYDVELERPSPLRYAHADQIRLFPDDLGCEHTARNSDKTIIWPSKEAQRYSGSVVSHLADLLRRRRGGG